MKAVAPILIALILLPLSGCYTAGYYTGKAVHMVIPSPPSPQPAATSTYEPAPGPAPQIYTPAEDPPYLPPAPTADVPGPPDSQPPGADDGTVSPDSGGY